MGNQCCSQSQPQSEVESSNHSISRQVSKSEPKETSLVKSLGESYQFCELIQKHSSEYMYQDQDGLLTTRLLSPRSQHVIVYLEPKTVADEAVYLQPEFLHGILSVKLREQGEPINNSRSPKQQRKVQFLD